MKAVFRTLTLVLTCTLFLGVTESRGCSMCKVTINGNTSVGNNEDSWRLGSRIWFETSKSGRLGCLFVGYDGHPQGGMNEAGLAFDGLAVYPRPVRNDPGKKEVSNPTEFLKEIMQTCKTAADVKGFALRYNRQKFFNNGEYMFVDKAGNYVVIEPDTLISGNDDRYLLANFCPSITSEEERLKNWGRYKRGRLFLNNHASDNSPDLVFALTDTMHECRKRIGGGTMYSYVANLNEGIFTLFFYHDFTHPITFNIQHELAKGDHALKLASIFPPNREYMRFTSIQTPRNNTSLLLVLFLGGGLFAFSSIFFLISLLWKASHREHDTRGRNAKLLLLSVSPMMLYYVTVLYRDEGVFFASAPFSDFNFSIHDLTAYMPFVLLVLIIPMLRFNRHVIRWSSWGFVAKSLFTLNNIAYLAFLALFFYWGLYTLS
jgi:hypothetical protein